MADAISQVQSSCLYPQKVEDSKSKNFHMKIIAGLVAVIAASLFALIPINGIALSFLAGAAVGVAGFFFPVLKDELFFLMPSILAFRKS